MKRLRACFENRPVSGPGLQGCRNRIVSCKPRALTRRFGGFLKHALSVLFAAFLCGQAVRGEAQSLTVSGVFPGPGGGTNGSFVGVSCLVICPEAAPNFTAALDGAEAVPPDNSPFTATAAVTLQKFATFFGQPVTNLVQFFVHFPDSLFTNGTSIFPSVVSIQRQGGEIVANASGAFVLSQVYYPAIEAPCLNTSTGWFCLQAAIRIDYQGWFLLSGEQVGELLAGQWYVDATSATTEGTVLPDYEIRGQILSLDSDNDGVPDYLDQCPDTRAGAVVDANGCSIDQLCPCEGPWRNHGEYLNCLRAVAAQFAQDGLITAAEAKLLLRQAASSDCGRR